MRTFLVVTSLSASDWLSMCGWKNMDWLSTIPFSQHDDAHQRTSERSAIVASYFPPVFPSPPTHLLWHQHTSILRGTVWDVASALILFLVPFSICVMVSKGTFLCLVSGSPSEFLSTFDSLLLCFVSFFFFIWIFIYFYPRFQWFPDLKGESQEFFGSCPSLSILVTHFPAFHARAARNSFGILLWCKSEDHPWHWQTSVPMDCLCYNPSAYGWSLTPWARRWHYDPWVWWCDLRPDP